MTPQVVRTRTARTLAVLATGAALSGALVVAAAPADATPVPYPSQSPAAPAVTPSLKVTFDATSNTCAFVLSNLKANSAVILQLSGGSAATGASFDGTTGLTVRSAAYIHTASAVAAPAAVAAGPVTATGTANASGVASLTASLAAFGKLSAAQVAALTVSVTGTNADGTPYSASSSLGSVALTSAGTAASGAALPRTGSTVDVAPLMASGFGMLVVGGVIVFVARRRRVDLAV